MKVLINNFHFHIMFRVLANPSVSFERATDMEASQQFWMSEDLLEHLLPMLDLPTLMTIAYVNPLVVSLLSHLQCGASCSKEHAGFLMLKSMMALQDGLTKNILLFS